MRDEHERRAALAIEPKHQLRHLQPARIVEIAGGLVGHQQLRLAGEGAGDRHALLLAAGKLLRIMRPPPGEADAVEPVRSLRHRIGGARELERQHHVLERGQRRQELERLEYEPEQPLPQRRTLILVLTRERDAVEPDVAFAWPIEPGKKPQQRRLAGAGRTDDRDRRPRDRRRS